MINRKSEKEGLDLILIGGFGRWLAEICSEGAVEDGDVGGEEGRGVGFAGAGSFAEGGLVAGSELFLLPSGDRGEMESEKKKKEEERESRVDVGGHGRGPGTQLTIRTDIQIAPKNNQAPLLFQLPA